MNITEFLEARIAEDEEEAKKYQHYEDQISETAGWYDCTRVLAECAAKRAILAIHTDRDGDCAQCSDYAWFAALDGGDHEEFPCPTVRAVASVYAAHPDYLQEWAPNKS